MADEFNLNDYLPEDTAGQETQPYTAEDEAKSREAAMAFIKQEPEQKKSKSVPADIDKYIEEKLKSINSVVEKKIESLTKQLNEANEKNKQLEKVSNDSVRAVNAIVDEKVLDGIKSQTNKLMTDPKYTDEIFADIFAQDKFNSKSIYEFQTNQIKERNAYFKPNEVVAVMFFDTVLEELRKARQLEQERAAFRGVERNFVKKDNGLDLRSEQDERRAVEEAGRGIF